MKVFYSFNVNTMNVGVCVCVGIAKTKMMCSKINEEWRDYRTIKAVVVINNIITTIVSERATIETIEWKFLIF